MPELKPYDKSQKLPDYVYTICEWIAKIFNAFSWFFGLFKRKKKYAGPTFIVPDNIDKIKIQMAGGGGGGSGRDDKSDEQRS